MHIRRKEENGFHFMTHSICPSGIGVNAGLLMDAPVTSPLLSLALPAKRILSRLGVGRELSIPTLTTQWCGISGIPWSLGLRLPSGTRRPVAVANCGLDFFLGA